MFISSSSIPLQRLKNLLYTFLGNDHHLQPITNLNMSLHRARKRIPDQSLHRILTQIRHLTFLQRMALATSGHMLILVVDLIVQERHDQTCRRAGRSALFALIAAHGVIRVQRALAILVHARQDRMHIVWEEALRVENRTQPLRARLHGHGLAVLVSVHLDDCVEAFFQGVAVGGEAHYRQDDARGWVVGSDAEEFGGMSGVDVVAGGGAGVAGEDGEGGACYPEGGSAVVGVAVAGGVR